LYSGFLTQKNPKIFVVINLRWIGIVSLMFILFLLTMFRVIHVQKLPTVGYSTSALSVLNLLKKSDLTSVFKLTVFCTGAVCLHFLLPFLSCV